MSNFWNMVGIFAIVVSVIVYYISLTVLSSNGLVSLQPELNKFMDLGFANKDNVSIIITTSLMTVIIDIIYKSFHNNFSPDCFEYLRTHEDEVMDIINHSTSKKSFSDKDFNDEKINESNQELINNHKFNEIEYENYKNEPKKYRDKEKVEYDGDLSSGSNFKNDLIESISSSKSNIKNPFEVEEYFKRSDDNINNINDKYKEKSKFVKNKESSNSNSNEIRKESTIKNIEMAEEINPRSNRKNTDQTNKVFSSIDIK